MPLPGIPAQRVEASAGTGAGTHSPDETLLRQRVRIGSRPGLPRAGERRPGERRLCGLKPLGRCPRQEECLLGNGTPAGSGSGGTFRARAKRRSERGRARARPPSGDPQCRGPPIQKGVLHETWSISNRRCFSSSILPVLAHRQEGRAGAPETHLTTLYSASQGEKRHRLCWSFQMEF